MPVFGFHETTADIADAVVAARARGCGALQVHQKSPQSYWAGKDFRTKNAGVASAVSSSKVRLFVHAGLMVNLADDDPRTRKLSAASLIQELDNASFLGAEAVVIHAGTAGKSRADSLRWFAESVQFVLKEADFKSKLLVETGALTGNSLAGELEELAELLRVCPGLGVCFDTCHTHAAGYDFHSERSLFDEFWLAWEDRIGLARLGLVHANGSQFPCGSRKDGHASLDGLHAFKGVRIEAPMINPESFRWLFSGPRFVGTAFVMETPPEHRDADLARALEWGG